MPCAFREVRIAAEYHNGDLWTKDANVICNLFASDTVSKMIVHEQNVCFALSDCFQGSMMILNGDYTTAELLQELRSNREIRKLIVNTENDCST